MAPAVVAELVAGVDDAAQQVGVRLRRARRRRRRSRGRRAGRAGRARGGSSGGRGRRRRSSATDGVAGSARQITLVASGPVRAPSGSSERGAGGAARRVVSPVATPTAPSTAPRRRKPLRSMPGQRRDRPGADHPVVASSRYSRRNSRRRHSAVASARPSSTALTAYSSEAAGSPSSGAQRRDQPVAHRRQHGGVQQGHRHVHGERVGPQHPQRLRERPDDGRAARRVERGGAAASSSRQGAALTSTYDGVQSALSTGTACASRHPAAPRASAPSATRTSPGRPGRSRSARPANTPASTVRPLSSDATTCSLPTWPVSRRSTAEASVVCCVPGAGDGAGQGQQLGRGPGDAEDRAPGRGLAPPRQAQQRVRGERGERDVLQDAGRGGQVAVLRADEQAAEREQQGAAAQHRPAVAEPRATGSPRRRRPAGTAGRPGRRA